MMLALVAPAVACGHGSAQNKAHAAPASAQKGAPVRDTDEAEAAYERGQKQLARGLTQEAINTFDDLKLTHPYSRFAALAELRSADGYAQRQEHLTAIDGYRAFLRFHPNHPEAPYALERVGQSYLAQMPKDFWPLPPAAEKDLDAIRQAIVAFEELLESHPGERASGAQEHLDACRKKLAEHEVYVARFYHQRKRYPGALARARTVLRDYAKLGYDAEAMYLAGTSLVMLGETEDGTAMLKRLVTEHPDSRWQREAERALGRAKAATPS